MIKVTLSFLPAVDFFNQINMLYGTITEFCTETSCPVMSAGPRSDLLSLLCSSRPAVLALGGRNGKLNVVSRSPFRVGDGREDASKSSLRFFSCWQKTNRAVRHDGGAYSTAYW